MKQHGFIKDAQTLARNEAQAKEAADILKKHGHKTSVGHSETEATATAEPVDKEEAQAPKTSAKPRSKKSQAKI